MTYWLIEPYDPLIVRDGRPFGPTPGARARSVPFPFPSTTAGGIRTRAGKDGNGRFNEALVSQVTKIKTRGPFLVELEGDAIAELLLPAPADALPLSPKEGSKQLMLKMLKPVALPPGAEMDLPPEVQYPVGLLGRDPRKPSRKAPRFWSWEVYERWLMASRDDTLPIDPCDLGYSSPVYEATDAADDRHYQLDPGFLGHNGPEADRRLHVAIDPATQTGEDGKLFMTSGLTFWREHGEGPTLDARRLSLLVEATGGDGLPERVGFDPLGGERRLMRWQHAPDRYKLPSVPDGLAARIAADGHCRVVLMTPAYFANGWRPDYLLQKIGNVTPELRAALVANPVVLSGWDMAAQKGGAPKPTRRLVPAGAVYYLKLSGSQAAVVDWLNAVWFQPISDLAADRDAGFGMAAVGVWSGAPAALDWKKENQHA